MDLTVIPNYMNLTVILNIFPNNDKWPLAYDDFNLKSLLLLFAMLTALYFLEEAYREFDEKFSLAKNSVHADRETLIDELSDKIERNLILLGATAVEDKLQNGVG